MGKGTISINPYHSDRQLMSPVGIAGLLATLVAFTDTKTFVLGRYHYLLYTLVTAMYPRFLITLDENLKSLPVTVRVGQAVDVVGQAGRPKTITGFQTHSTPVLLAHSERAELATEECELLFSVHPLSLVIRTLYANPFSFSCCRYRAVTRFRGLCAFEKKSGFYGRG